jgi:hypothetical protein
MNCSWFLMQAFVAKDGSDYVFMQVKMVGV